jgi:hypothetical protein
MSTQPFEAYKYRLRLRVRIPSPAPNPNDGFGVLSKVRKGKRSSRSPSGALLNWNPC